MTTITSGSASLTITIASKADLVEAEDFKRVRSHENKSGIFGINCGSCCDGKRKPIVANTFTVDDDDGSVAERESLRLRFC